MLRIEHLSKSYPDSVLPAVENLSLEIHEGEVFTLLGPSGCGKTTTLRMVAGLEVPDRGAIYFREQAVFDTNRHLFIPTHKRNVGMVFQSYAIWPHMTVEENVAFPLKLRRLPRQELDKRVRQVLELVGLDGLEKRQAPSLSGGQQQRVALARALVYEPNLLLLDEPFSNLEARLRAQMREELSRLQNRLKITILLVTHDQVEALSLAHRIAIMNQGKLQQTGSPLELYEQPANAFVRDFLGKTVLFKGTVLCREGQGRIAVSVRGAPNCVVLARSRETDIIHKGMHVTLALRPQDITLTASMNSSLMMEAVRGVVEDVVFVGERMEYRIRVPEQRPLVAYSPRWEVFRPGQQVDLRLRIGKAELWIE